MCASGLSFKVQYRTVAGWLAGRSLGPGTTFSNFFSKVAWEMRKEKFRRKLQTCDPPTDPRSPAMLKVRRKGLLG